ncbi:MAG: hypothetical protein GF398_18855 [Chitinivibrionales bacterium]|nr:hypothetical protein [Chitinivibrionales bacterium]
MPICRGSIACAFAVLFIVFPRTNHAATFIGAGGKASLLAIDDLGLGVGMGGHMQFGIDLRRAGELHIYPNIDFWFSSEEYYRTTPPPWWYQDRQYWNDDIWWDLNVFELSINLDARYYFPLPAALKVNPYAGLGLAPIITIYDWDPKGSAPGWVDDNETEIGVAANIMGGVDFPLSPSMMLFAEMKGKAGSDFELFKFSGGITFRL